MIPSSYIVGADGGAAVAGSGILGQVSGVVGPVIEGAFNLGSAAITSNNNRKIAKINSEKEIKVAESNNEARIKVSEAWAKTLSENSQMIAAALIAVPVLIAILILMFRS